MFRTRIAALRAALQVTLLMMFMWYFGCPAVERYNEKKVIVVTTGKHTEGIASPSLSVLVQNPIRKNGWKQKLIGLNDTSMIRSYCQDLEDSTIVDCIKKKTYSFEDGIKDVILGFSAAQSLIGDRIWKTDFQMTTRGRSYTIHIPRKLTPN